MRFEILGPLRVVRGAEIVPVAGQKERHLLAILLARHGQVVPVDTLIDGLWGEDPPPTAAKSLQAHVVRLRDALEPDRPRGDQGSLIRTVESGYCLIVDPESVDAQRFERLTEDGRMALRSGAVETASALLTEGLELWHGLAYGGLDGPVVAAAGARLEQLRRVALEDRLDAELAAGRARQLIPELEALVAVDQLAERTWCQLMLAQYGAGRQADALATFHRARQALLDELGVDPGSELSDLQRRILEQDPTLEGRGYGAIRRLPAALDVDGPMIGRASALRELLHAWDEAKGGRLVVIAIGGPRGIGKTRLVAELARRIAGQGALVYASARPESSDPAALLARLAAEIDRPDLGGVDAGTRLGAAIRGITRQDPLLLVAEDIDPMADRVEAGLGDLLDGLGDRPTLVVLTGSAIPATLQPRLRDNVVLHQLDEAETAALVASVLGEDDAELAARDIAPAARGVPGDLVREALGWRASRARALVGRAVKRAAASRVQLRDAQRELAAGIATWQEATDPPPAPGAPTPYKGLARFDVEDSALFFGREKVLPVVAGQLATARLVGIVGPSGIGKSSFARAGLIASLADGILPGSETWRWHVVVPGGDETTLGLPEPVTGEQTILLVDQLEQLFVSCADEGLRRGYLDQLAALATDEAGTRVVVTLRADHFGRVVESPGFAAALSEATVVLGPMSVAEVQRAIELPARRAGARLEPGLAAAISGDVTGQAGALPLLSTALLELWERRDGSVMTWSGYRAAGGVQGAVARLAEDAFGRLDDTEQMVARRILLRTAAGRTGEDDEVGRRVPLDELASEGDTGARVLALLAERRLLTLDEGIAEVAHEALYREWPRLRGWLEEDREGRALQIGIIAAARDWDREGRQVSDLYRGPRLFAALSWAADHDDELNERERAFLDAGRAVAEREVHEAKERASRMTRANRRLRIALAGLAAVLALAVGAGVLAAWQSDAAQREARAADAARIGASALVEADLDRSLLMAAAAWELDPSLENRGSLIGALLRAPDLLRITRYPNVRLTDTAVSPDGRFVAIAANDTTIHVRDWESNREIATREPGGEVIFHMDFTSDGKALLTAEWAPGGWLVERFDFATGERRELGRIARTEIADISIRPETGAIAFVAFGAVPEHGEVGIFSLDDGSVDSIWDFEGRPFAVDVASDGRLAAVVGDATEIRDPDGPLIARANVAGELEFSPGGSRLAVGLEDGTVVVLDASSGAEVDRQIAHAGAVGDLLFSPDGSRLLSAADDGTIAIWDTERNEVRRLTTAGSGAVRVNGLSVTADGRTLFSASHDGTAAVWDLTGERRFGRRAAALPDFVSSVARLPDGRIAAANFPGAVTIAESDMSSVRTLEPGLDGITAVGASRDGASLAIGLEDGRIALLDVERGKLRSDPVQVRDVPIQALAFAPDGPSVVVAAEDGLFVWNPHVGGSPRVLVENRHAWNVAFDPTGQRLAAVLDGASRGLVPELHIWSWPSGEPLVTSPTGEVASTVLAWHPSGDRVATADFGGQVHLFNAATGEPISTASVQHAGLVNGLAFAPSGDLLASGGADGAVMLWDASTLRRVGAPLSGKPRYFIWPVFDRSGREIVAVEEEGSVFAWTVDPEQLVGRVCRTTGRELTAAEWTETLPGGTAMAVCEGMTAEVPE